MKLSIITINKNNASGLEKTIQSVINQTYKDFEYIIIDGNSTDESIEIIKKNSKGIKYWVSEPDTGIYNAMNKGIRKAQGDYCLFLNSGDWIISSTTLQDVYNEISNIFIPVDIFYSNCVTTNGYICIYPDNLTINNYLGTGINHQNSLIKRSLFREHGFYNEELRIASDVEFFLKELWIYKSKFIKIKTNISIFDINGIGSRLSHEIFEEDIICYKNVFQELSEVIIEINKYRKTFYYNILKDYNETKLLYLLLRTYKFFISRIQKTKRFFIKIKSKVSGTMKFC